MVTPYDSEYTMSMISAPKHMCHFCGFICFITSLVVIMLNWMWIPSVYIIVVVSPTCVYILQLDFILYDVNNISV